ncbi:unnamed protein product [Durusdinium trenchii]|uniref:Helicase C-terminal domain-containing protein n=1 Tax=Durusdinium trenchii TaxID=1381693 RepID=A0ABP0I6B1_9DINO
MNVAKTAAIHGDLDQSKREESLTKFREGNAQVLIATDLASRGLDISGVSFVINYDAPKEIATYVHRIGRTGRIGHRGTAMTFVTMEGCWCHDTDEFLRELPAMMEKAPNTEIPPWLAELSEQKNNDTWYSKKNDWQTTDVRYEKTDNTTFDGWDVKEEEEGGSQNLGGWSVCLLRLRSRCGAVRIFGHGGHFSWQAQVQTSWQAQYFRSSTVWTLKCKFRGSSWQVQYFLDLEVQISWQAQYFVDLEKCRFRGRVGLVALVE